MPARTARSSVWARYDAEDRNVTIGVTDNGPGIAPEHVKLIFDRFQQLPEGQGRAEGRFRARAAHRERAGAGQFRHAGGGKRAAARAAPSRSRCRSSTSNCSSRCTSTSCGPRGTSFQKVVDRAGDGPSATLTARHLRRSSARCTGSFAPTTCCSACDDGNWLVCAAGDHGRACQDHRTHSRHLRRDQSQPPGRQAAGDPLPPDRGLDALQPPGGTDGRHSRSLPARSPRDARFTRLNAPRAAGGGYERGADASPDRRRRPRDHPGDRAQAEQGRASRRSWLSTASRD